MDVVEVKQGRLYVGKLPYESDLLDSIKELLERLGISSAIFFVIGAVKRAHLAYYHQVAKRYLDFYVDKPMEIVSCVGNVATLEGKLLPHAHMILSDSEGNVRGGHVLSGTTVFAAEIHLMEIAGARLERSYDEVTGLNLFKFQ